MLRNIMKLQKYGILNVERNGKSQIKKTVRVQKNRFCRCRKQIVKEVANKNKDKANRAINGISMKQ